MEKTIFLTGATSSIGEVIAIHLSQKYNIVLSGRNNEKLKSLKERCSSKNKIYVLPLDLTELGNIEITISNFLKNEKITIEKFIHCAGFMKMVPLKLVSIDLLNTTFSTNIFSANILAKLFINKKINQAALENIVFISSNISNMGAKAMSTYGASKSALDGLMKCLAVELAPKVRVNSVLPGAILTEMSKSIFENEEVFNNMKLTYPLGIGKPNDIYEIVDFLLCEKSNWITGQQITVDGGRSINISS